MRLAIVSHNIVRGDGQGRANYEIARYALREGFTVRLIANRVDQKLIDAGAEWIAVRPHLPRPNLVKVWELAHEADRLLSRLLPSVDIVHGCGFTLRCPHHINTSQYVHAAWLRSPVHTSRVHRNAYGAYQWMYSTLNARWEKQTYSKAQTVVAASEQVRQELEGIGVAAKRLRVILNGVDLKEFFPGSVDRKAVGLPEKVPLALFVGDIRTPRKNLDTVLKALTYIPDAHLAVVGAVANSPYPTMAAQLGLTERVHFLDFRRDVAQLMRAADVFVFPSRYEACALVLMEAMASGLPVITARTTGGAEALTPDCGVILEDANDPKALAAPLQALVEDPARRICMGEAARNVAEKYSWANIADAYLSLYREIAA